MTDRNLEHNWTLVISVKHEQP